MHVRLLDWVEGFGLSECILRVDPARLQVDRSCVVDWMPTSPHRRVQRDSSAKTLRSWVYQASEAPDGSTTTYAEYDARRVCAKNEIARNRFSLKSVGS